MASSLGKNHGSLAGQQAGTLSQRGRGSLPGANAKNSSALPPLGRNDLIREVQAIVLQFPTKQVAEEQDATTKAVECQRNGDSAASLLAAANMARANPRARAMFARLFGFTDFAHTDPDFVEGAEKMAHAMFRQHMDRMGMPHDYGYARMEALARQDDRDAQADAQERDTLTADLFGSVH